MFFAIDTTFGYVFGAPSRWVTYAIKPHVLRLWNILYRVTNPVAIIGIAAFFFWQLTLLADTAEANRTASDLSEFVQNLTIWAVASTGVAVILTTIKGIRDQIRFTQEAIKEMRHARHRISMVMSSEFVYQAIFPMAQPDTVPVSMSSERTLRHEVAKLLSTPYMIEARKILLKKPVGLTEKATHYGIKLRVLGLVKEMYQASGLWMTHPSINEELKSLTTTLSVEMQEAASMELEKLKAIDSVTRAAAEVEFERLEVEMDFARSVFDMTMPLVKQ